MESENFLLTIAVIAVLVSAFGLGFTYVTLENFKQNWLTGFVTSSGTVNVSISTSAAINFTTSLVNWGSGNVNNGSLLAVLDTSAGTVTNGTWTPVTTGFKIENYGNVNVSLSLKTGLNASGFIGGTSPLYQYNVTNNETSSCINSTALGVWQDVNATAPSGTLFCSLFSFLDSSDLIRVDIKLAIPYNSKTDTLTDTLTATATAL